MSLTMLSQLVVALVALEHVWILVLEMFLWRKPIGRRAFGSTQAFADASAKLAMNQGLYNGFLAAGLIWSLLITSAAESFSFKVFFLGCVSIAGVFGGATVSPRIFLIQSVPALVGLGLVIAGS